MPSIHRVASLVGVSGNPCATGKWTKRRLYPTRLCLVRYETVLVYHLTKILAVPTEHFITLELSHMLAIIGPQIVAISVT
ncbi:hypothetical protein [uncultured Ruegeria sp.]|uniref:hypothetical protein n=1 Tax=uncultured Ruegeria sp. TaxID=259304 RepID=UPI002603CE36|nr:hypothetical protein [uncultured Ruegeria sp.]